MSSVATHISLFEAADLSSSGSTQPFLLLAKLATSSHTHTHCTLCTVFAWCTKFDESLETCYDKWNVISFGVYKHETYNPKTQSWRRWSASRPFVVISFFIWLGQKQIVGSGSFSRGWICFSSNSGIFSSSCLRINLPVPTGRENLPYTGEDGGRSSWGGFLVLYCNVTISCAPTCWHAFKWNKVAEGRRVNSLKILTE